MQALQKIKDGFQKGDLSSKFRGSAMEGAFLAFAHAGLTQIFSDSGADPALSAGVGLCFITIDTIQHLRNAASDGKFGYMTKLSDAFNNFAKNTAHFAAAATPLYVSEFLIQGADYNLMGDKPAFAAFVLATFIGLKTWVDHTKSAKVVHAEQEQQNNNSKNRPKF